MGIADTIGSMVSYEKRKRNRKAREAIIKRQKFKCKAVFYIDSIACALTCNFGFAYNRIKGAEYAQI